MFKTLPAELSPWRRKRKMRMRRSAEGSVSSATRCCTERRAGFFIYGVAAVNTAPPQPFVHVRAVSQTFLYVCKIKNKKWVKSAVVFFFFFLQKCLVLFGNAQRKTVFCFFCSAALLQSSVRKVFSRLPGRC